MNEMEQIKWGIEELSKQIARLHDLVVKQDRELQAIKSLLKQSR
ncbi:hypothetical protein [Corynebacterium oculi]|uniref:Uncharacterized protein n=1 Tax=Corynebacterium oculi TaxID=1544416 RepID=A0A0Q0Z5Z8_9CORY|nr:hypothetical protein [Corynebacterium oculi]KQB84951.1 hypothetical protein Cocul_00081 [Corynebacterium oculi]